MLAKGILLKYSLLGFIVYPFAAFLIALKNVRFKLGRLVIFLWFMVFGLTFQPINKSADSFRYYQDFQKERTYTFETYVSLVEDYFSFSGDAKDIYTLTIHYFVGQYTSNYHYVFLIYAIVFGFFYVKTMKFLCRRKMNNQIAFYLIFIFLFCYSNPIFNINGTRFYTAAWITVYSLFNIIIDKRYSYGLLLLLTPLVHGTYMMIALPLLIYLLFQRFQKFWIVIFVLSCFVSAVSFVDIIGSQVSFLPKFLQNQFYEYAVLQLGDKEQAEVFSYAKILFSIPQIFIDILVFLLITKRKFIVSKSISDEVLTFVLVWFAVFNILSIIPSVGRFCTIGIPFVSYLLIENEVYLKNNIKIVYLLPIVYAYSLRYWLIDVSSVTPDWLYMSPLPLILSFNFA